MNIDQLQQIKANGIQQLNSNREASNTNENSIFSKKLEDLIQSMSGQNNISSANDNALEGLINTAVSQNNSSSINGLDSLALQPDKISRMMELLSYNNSPSESQGLSLANAFNIDDSDADDDDGNISDNSSLGIGDIMGEGNGMTQLLQAIVENQNAASNEDDQSEFNGQQKNTISIPNTSEI